MYDHKCVICGKNFIVPIQPIFKVRDKKNTLHIVCSWSCYRKATEQMDYKKAAYQ